MAPYRTSLGESLLTGVTKVSATCAHTCIRLPYLEIMCAGASARAFERALFSKSSGSLLDLSHFDRCWLAVGSFASFGQPPVSTCCHEHGKLSSFVLDFAETASIIPREFTAARAPLASRKCHGSFQCLLPFGLSRISVAFERTGTRAKTLDGTWSEDASESVDGPKRRVFGSG